MILGAASAARTAVDRRRQQRIWYSYDWANSGFFTTVVSVLVGPYLTTIAARDACPGVATTQACAGSVTVLGIPIDPGSLVSYVLTVSTLLAAVLLPMIGALVDQIQRPRLLLGGFAWVGAAATGSLWWVTGVSWQWGAGALLLATLCFAASLVVYDALLVDVAEPAERHAVSSRGWALGYLAGFLLLGVNLGLINGHEALGISTETAVRFCFLLAGCWWAGFTFIAALWLADRPGPRRRRPAAGALVRELRGTFAQLRQSPQTLRFLIAYFIFNDGIQTVIVASSIYGAEELGLDTATLVFSVVVVQLVALLGALLCGALAQKYPAKNIVLGALGIWVVVVIIGFYLPAARPDLWFALAASVGLVLGGTQALSRSIFSQLIPAGREAQYFGFYQAGERGTSWTGTLVFGVVHQLTDSYRPALIAMAGFFIVGGLLLRRVQLPTPFTGSPHSAGTTSPP